MCLEREEAGDDERRHEERQLVRGLGLELELGVDGAKGGDEARVSDRNRHGGRNVHRVEQVEKREEGHARDAGDEEVVLVVPGGSDQGMRVRSRV